MLPMKKKGGKCFSPTFSLAFIIFINAFDNDHLDLGTLEFQYNFDLHCSNGEIDHFSIFTSHLCFLFMKFLFRSLVHVLLMTIVLLLFMYPLPDNCLVEFSVKIL